MAVFTAVTREEAGAWLARYPVGELLDLQGIGAGVENTNFFVTAAGGQFVLTIFEKLSRGELPFYLDLMAHLAARGVPCPLPIRARDGSVLGELKDKPAALMSRLAGEAVMTPSAAHCAQVGSVLASMHLAARDFPDGPDNPRGPQWWCETAPQVSSFLDGERRLLLGRELAFQAAFSRLDLPRGPVHADLFRDNVLFSHDGVGGVIDFYFAGVDAFLFDVAVTVNDWCIDHATGAIDPPRAAAFLDAYRLVRPFIAAEKAAWHVMLRGAALRFWLSRLYDFYLPRPGHLIKAHDPEHFCRVLKLRVEQPGDAPLL